MNFLKYLLVLIICCTSSLLIGQNKFNIWVDAACGMCKDRIENAAMSLDKIQFVNYDLSSKTLSIETSDANFDVIKLHQKMAAVGHDTKEMKATDEVYNNLHGCCKYRDLESHGSNSETVNNKYQIWVDAACGMCKDRIELAVLAMDKIQFVHYNLNTKLLTLETSNPDFDVMQLHQKMASIGHDTKELKASDEVYEALHECCKYRDLDEVEDIDQTYQFQDVGQPKPPKANEVSGMVYERNEDGEEAPLIGANVYWLNTTSGTSTDVDGHFIINENPNTDQLIVSYLGIQDTIKMQGQKMVAITFDNSILMDEITVTHKKRTTQISFIEPLKVHQIDEKELLKAACCNLSESFETTPAVDVSFTDAVTGTRKIEMLGLAGPNVQITRESMPYIRGLAATYGFAYTPGPWIEGMQLSMGVGSVVNGPESITGQINLEIKKPETADKLYVNLYANQAARLEANILSAHKLSDKISTSLFVHAENRSREIDRNKDGFLDTPFKDGLILMNRWKFDWGEGLMTQLGIKTTLIDQTSGQLPSLSESGRYLWQADIETNRYEAWLKIGKVYPSNPYTSVGFQLSAMHHDQNSLFGTRPYFGNQTNVYANLLFQSVIGDSRNGIKGGLSFSYDNYDERFVTLEYSRKEIMPGGYVEYTYNPADKFSILTGLRFDHHNLYGAFLTPRIHIRYSPEETTAWRFMAGKGLRTASIFAENIGAFAGNRDFIIHEENPNYAYGLNPEIAWNFGVNFTKELSVLSRSLVFGIDYYYTTFQNQVVVDYDLNPQEIHFYNLNGSSYSHSIQTHLDYQLNEQLDIRLAYRYNDVQTEFQEGLEQKQLIAKHRAFANIAYEFIQGWNFDLTANWIGPKRIPFTASNPSEFQLATTSPSFVTINSQVSGKMSKNMEAYLGAENLLNYRQENPILAAGDPNSRYFDSSLVWGPILGRNIYIGIRYKLP
ncbi:MAG: TonB-dependent receptor [Bacteroidota bacterium]